MRLNIFVLSVLFFLFSFSCKTDSQISASEVEVKKESSNQKNTTSVSANKRTVFSQNEVLSFSRGSVINDINIASNASLIKKTDAYYSYSTNGKEELKLYRAFDPRNEIYTDLVSKIIIVSNKFEDEKGVHIGSKVSAFLKAYPNAVAYFNAADPSIILSNNGQGPQYILPISSIKSKEAINIGKIPLDFLDINGTINEIRIMRSEAENEMAKSNKSMEEQQILEDFLATVETKYYQIDYSENYYKIHKMQGNYYVSECFEDQCNKRGKINKATKEENGFISLELEGIQGMMVPSWSLKITDNNTELHVHDYNANEDTWTDKIYNRAK